MPFGAEIQDANHGCPRFALGAGMTLGGRNDDGPDWPIRSTEDFLQGSCIKHLVQPVIQLGLAGLFDALFEVVGQWTKFM